MNNPSFIFQGRIYNAKIGEILTLKQPTDFPGDGMRITTSEYEIFAKKISYDKNKVLLKIEKINPVSISPKVPELEVNSEDLPEKPNLSKYTKSQLMEFAENIGIEFTTEKITKKEIIELINQEYEK